MRRSAPSSEPPDVSSRVGDTDRSKLHYALRDRSETDPAAAATRDFTIDSVMAATQNDPHSPQPDLERPATQLRGDVNRRRVATP